MPEEQEDLFAMQTPTEDEWQDMPEFQHEDLSPWKQVLVSFESRKDMLAFAELVGQPLTEQTQSIWFPKATITRLMDKRYKNES